MLVALFDAEEARLRDVDERELLISFADHASLALDRALAVGDRELLAVALRPRAHRPRPARHGDPAAVRGRHAAAGGGRSAAGRSSASGCARASRTSTAPSVTSAPRSSSCRPRAASPCAATSRPWPGSTSRSSGFTPTVRTSGPLDTVVPDVLREQLLPVLREALSNVARHAHATRVEVEVVVDAGHAAAHRPRRRDRARPEGAPRAGCATRGDRAHLLGGDLELTPARPHGLVLHWRAPLERAAED